MLRWTLSLTRRRVLVGQAGAVFHVCGAGRVPFLGPFFSGRRGHTRFGCDWSADVCSSDLTKGLGRAVAKALAQEGARGVVNGRHPESVERVSVELGAGTGQGVTPAVADVGVPAQAEG